MGKISLFINKISDRLGFVRKSAISSNLQSNFSSIGIGIPTQENYDEYLKAYTNESWVYVCINKIATAIAGLPIKIYKPSRKNKNKFDEILTHPFLILLNKPNEKESQFELIESLIANTELTGNSYLLLDELKGKTPQKLYSIISSRIKVLGKDKGFKYKYAGIDKSYNNDEIKQFLYFNPTSEYYGLSPIAAGRYIIETNQQSNKFNAEFFKNGASFDGVLETENALNETTFQRIKKQFSEKYTGTKNAHKTPILEQGTKYKSIQLTQRDMEFINGQKMNRETICAIFGVPPAVAGLLEYSNYSNVVEQKKLFWNDTIIPKIKKLRNFLQNILNLYGDNSLWLDFDLSAVESLRENEDLKSQIAARYFSIGIPVNQIIEKLNLPFDTIPGGDRGYLPFNLSPVGNPVSAPALPPAKTIKSITPEQKRKKWDMMIKVTEALEKKYSVDINKFFNQQENEVIANLNKYKNLNIAEIEKGINYIYELKDNTKAQVDIDTVIFDYDEAVGKFRKLSEPYKSVALEEAGKTEFELLNIRIAFDMSSASIVEYLREHGLEQAKLIMDTAKDSVRTALLEGLKEKETIQQLSKRINEVYAGYTEGGLEGYQANRIVRTEMIEASNYGNHEAYKQAGIKKRSWVAAFDSITCEICSGLDSEIVGIDEKFSSGDIDPPNHCNCRCTTAPEIEE